MRMLINVYVVMWMSYFGKSGLIWRRQNLEFGSQMPLELQDIVRCA